MMSEGLNINGATSSNISSDVEEAPVLKALASHFERWPTVTEASNNNVERTIPDVISGTNAGLINPFWKK